MFKSISPLITRRQNAFSEFSSKLAARSTVAANNIQYSAFLFMMLLVDFMHEWELGVWKALLIHLLRIVTSQGVLMIETLDSR